MTRSELIQRAKWRLSAKPVPGRTQESVDAAITRVLEPLDARDARAKERNVLPYNYSSEAVLWLEREIRRELANGARA